MFEAKNVKEIKVTYEDGSEKLIKRGVCFSVYEKNETIFVNCDGIAGKEGDCVAVLAIVSRIAKELGIDEELMDKAEVVE